MEKINIAELLKNCSPDMELDCTIYDNVYFDQIYDDDSYLYPIGCYTIVDGIKTSIGFTKFGTFNTHINAKCVIFPKGKTTWEGFVPPCKFKDGDILYINCSGDECTYEHNKYIFILKEISDNKIYCYCYIDEVNKYKKFGISWLSDTTYTPRFATEEEKQKLFDAIKENGYKWNADTKTLEKIVEPKFKVGDKITNGNISITIDYMDNECYYDMGRNNITRLFIKYQDDWKLVPNKFDINTLVPFESRVLVRHNKDNKWCGSFFSHIDKDFHSHCYKFVTTAGKSYPMMIPYENNEHLIGKDKDCDEFYKTWE